MAYQFEIHPQALKRKFSVYVVVATGGGERLLYVGKTGDNREGCNPLISRCGNHFSYNRIHSQVRNKIPAHEDWTYNYVFDHFDDYCDDWLQRRERIDRINEMERWLNLEIQKTIGANTRWRLLNPYRARGHVGKDEAAKRSAFRTAEAQNKVQAIVLTVQRILPI